MDDHKEEDFRSYGIRLGEYCSKLLPCLTGEWLERLMPVPGVIIANPAVSGVISGKLILTAGLIQSILWRELALCFDFDSHCISQWAKFQLSFHHMCNSTPADKSEAKLVHCSLSRPRMAHSNTCFLHSLKTGPLLFEQTPAKSINKTAADRLFHSLMLSNVVNLMWCYTTRSTYVSIPPVSALYVEVEK